MSWPVSCLGDVSEFIRNGASIPQSKDAGGVPITRIESISERIFNQNKCGYAGVGDSEYLEYRLRLGDILVSHINSEKHLAKCVIFEDEGFDVIHGMNLLCARPDQQKIFPKFLFHYLSSPKFLHLIPAITKKSVNQASFTVTAFKELPIPLPPLPEQKRIAAILDKADAIRRKRQQAIQLADDFLRAVFLEMFGDPVTNPKGWEVRLSGELFSVPPRIGTTTPADGQGSLVVRVGEIGKQDINFSKCGRAQLKDSELERFILHSGDTVLARAIGSKNKLGKASFFSGYSENVYIDSHVMRLRPNVKICNPEWFYRFISSDGGKSLLQKAGGETAVQFNINAKQAASLLIPLPPIERQNEFVDFCQKHSKSKTHLSKQAGDVEMLFSSLSQKAFSGQL